MLDEVEVRYMDVLFQNMEKETEENHNRPLAISLQTESTAEL